MRENENSRKKDELRLYKGTDTHTKQRFKTEKSKDRKNSLKEVTL